MRDTCRRRDVHAYMYIYRATKTPLAFFLIVPAKARTGSACVTSLLRRWLTANSGALDSVTPAYLHVYEDVAIMLSADAQKRCIRKYTIPPER